MCPKPILTLIVVSVGILGLACSEPEPFDRLVDHAQRQGATSEPDGLWLRAPDAPLNREGGDSVLPGATIDHDTRYVLAAHPRQVVANRKGLKVGPDGLTIFEESMADFFPDAKNLLINTRVLVVGEKDWRTLPPMLRRLEEMDEDSTLRLEFALDDVPEDTIIHAWIDAYQAPPVGGTRYVTAPRLVPQRSRLTFSFGILDAALLQGPVRFSVSACEQEICEPLFSEVFDLEQKDQSAWQERSVSLSSVWGQTRSLEFEAVPERADSLSLPVWGNPRVVVESEVPTRPNVILLSVDTLRSDHLDVYGYSRETMPFVTSRIAPNGAVFENFISEAATTEVSHMSMFTSLPALVHGTTRYDRKLAVPVMTLAEAFRGQGFDTAAFTEAGPLDPQLGFDIGFDRWKENPDIYFYFPVGQVERVFAQGWDWIAQRRDRPFFLFLHTFQVHYPLSPPIAYRELFLDDEIERSEEMLQVAKYDQEIRFVDDQLALLWTKLENNGLSQNTILILVSDHGDEFWEHGERGHGSLPYEEVLKVPLIMMGPGVAKGVRNQQPLHHVDLMPTILELAEIPVPAHVLGESFADAVRGLDASSEVPAVERVRTSASWAVPDGVSVPVFAIRDQHLKVIVYEEGAGTRLKCFALESDPNEKMDLCSEGPTAEVTQLLSHLETYEAEMQAKRISLAGQSLDGEEGQTIPVSPDQEAHLRALGYVE